MRKVALASILIYNPKVLFLDEPTVGFDEESKKSFLKLIKMLKKRYHKTIVMVSHDIEYIHKFADEIIVIDDGSSIHHTKRLTSALKGANEFLIRANDLYEVVTYSKAIKFANSKYIALLQDDDDFESLQWIEDALHLFREHPDMAILGGKGHQKLVFHDKEQRVTGGNADYKNDTFCFAMSVNRAPMLINKELYTNFLSPGIDISFAPFQYDDNELCARAWLNGLKVGWFDAKFFSMTAGGMRIWNKGFTDEQCIRNGKKLYKMYKEKADELTTLVAEANKNI